MWYWLEVENTLDEAQTLDDAHQRYEVFLQNHQSFVDHHGDLLLRGTKLVLALQRYEHIIVVSDVDRTPATSHIKEILDDLKNFLSGLTDGVEMIKDKLRKSLDFLDLKREASKVTLLFSYQASSLLML